MIFKPETEFLKIMYFQAKLFEKEIDSNLKNNFNNNSNLRSRNSTVKTGIKLDEKKKNLYISSDKMNDKKKTKKFNFKSKIRMFDDRKQNSLYNYFKMNPKEDKLKLKKKKKKIKNIKYLNKKPKNMKSTKKLGLKQKDNYSLRKIASKENFIKKTYKSINRKTKSKSKKAFRCFLKDNSKNKSDFEIIKYIKSYQKLRFKFQKCGYIEKLM